MSKKWFIGECEWCTHHGSVTEDSDTFMCWQCASIGTTWHEMHEVKPYTILNVRENYVRKGF